MIDYPKIDYQNIIYYSAPKTATELESLDEIDPELRKTYEQARHFDRGTETDFRGPGRCRCGLRQRVGGHPPSRPSSRKQGIIFGSFSQAVQNHPELVKRYLGSVVPYSDNFFACLNSAVFSDGSFAYIPKGVRCPMELLHLFSNQCGGNRPIRAAHC